MKKITLAILALVLVTVTTAFTWQHNNDNSKKAVNTAYFEYQMNTTSGENEEENWLKVSEPSSNCLENEGVLCTISAPIANPTDIHPDFSGVRAANEDVRTSDLITDRTFKP